MKVEDEVPVDSEVVVAEPVVEVAEEVVTNVEEKQEEVIAH